MVWFRSREEIAARALDERIWLTVVCWYDKSSDPLLRVRISASASG